MRRSKMQSQDRVHPQNAEGTNIEESGNHTAEISELIVSEVKKQLRKGTTEIRAEIISETNKHKKPLN